MENIGREESKYTINTGIYGHIISSILGIILAIWLLSFSQGKLNSFFLSRDDIELYEFLSVCSILVIIGGIIDIINDTVRMKSYLSVCENGIEGRTTASFFYNKQVALPYSDISSVDIKRSTVIVKTKSGESLRFFILNAEQCEREIKSKML